MKSQERIRLAFIEDEGGSRMEYWGTPIPDEEEKSSKEVER